MGYPFDRSGTVVGADGMRRYTGLPRNLVHLLPRRRGRAPRPRGAWSSWTARG